MLPDPQVLLTSTMPVLYELQMIRKFKNAPRIKKIDFLVMGNLYHFLFSIRLV